MNILWTFVFFTVISRKKFEPHFDDCRSIIVAAFYTRAESTL